MTKLNYNKLGKLQAKRDRKRIEAEQRNRDYQNLPESEKKRRNPSKYL